MDADQINPANMNSRHIEVIHGRQLLVSVTKTDILPEPPVRHEQRSGKLIAAASGRRRNLSCGIPPVDVDLLGRGWGNLPGLAGVAAQLLAGQLPSRRLGRLSE